MFHLLKKLKKTLLDAKIFLVNPPASDASSLAGLFYARSSDGVHKALYYL